MLPEESSPAPARRSRSTSLDGEQSTAPEASSSTPVVSSLLPRSDWAIALLVISGLLTWATVIGVGVWLDLQQLDPWHEIFGLRSGRLLRFYTTISLLTCAQLSYLILWRRSRSRKDFAGRYRVWFWVGAVCSTFCVATATRFHESWARQLTSGFNLVWTDAATVCWLVPATTLLLSVMHLMRRDMLYKSASRRWVQVSRGLAIVTGVSLLLSSLVLPAEWVTPVNAALASLWPTVFASTLLIHARFVTYVTNEASRERKQPTRTSRWEARLKVFARHVALLASEEWQLYQQKRAAAKAAKLVAIAEEPLALPEAAPVSEPKPKRERRAPSATPSAMASAPLQKMMQQPRLEEEELDSLEDAEVESRPAPTTRAVNVRPISRSESSPPVVMQTLSIHPAQPIPPPHFEITEPVMSDEDVGENEPAGQSQSIPAGYSPEQWRSLSKKDRKRLRRTESVR